MQVSVVIPLYNARPYIVQAVESILAQTLPAAEIVVVDDGSTDGGADLLAGYGPAVRVIHQQQSGSATAINRGIAATRHEVMAFLDADDLWTPDKLSLQVPALAGDPSIDGVFSHVRQFSGSHPDAADATVQPPQAGVSRNTLLIWRSAFDRYGLFDASLRTADFVPWYSYAVAAGLKTRVLPDVVAFRRLHGANTGIVRRHDQQQESLMGLKRALDFRRKRQDTDNDPT
jgi:glycosyltransferase involved in cell wall biosynthesis